ncbi:dTDP-4-dehydrorhamnose 3,5-epimerase family protein [Fluviispira vulneris]|uniref:dTDP-4-dehydrorhamnose 3,5-epimerase family protein n=1 Tax=Fluviispira vulneris TaxID=2763012 RepID=UPI0016468EF6|nr:dTDP-4-dehydrorhamnose 3,5-epimerase family protein [Fluviispira vulneris]
MIHGVRISPLKQILDERGKIMHMMRNDSEVFKSFGEIYFSCVYPNAIKGWHIHKEMTLNYCVPYGNIKFVLYDDRENSPTRGNIQEIFLGVDNYLLVSVPPKIWNGFKGLGNETAIVANCASIPHSSHEIERLDPLSEIIPYKWGLINK